MKVKCYGLFQAEREIILQFANPSQKDFLDYELKNALRRLKKGIKIEFQNTANGVWYCRQQPKFKNLTQILLLQKGSSSVSLAASFFSKASAIQQAYDPIKDRQKIRIKIDDLIKIYNANKLDKLNNNVMELQDIAIGNVKKLVTNIGQLQTAERKSSILTELSMQFEKDSKTLQNKMKRRKWLMRICIGGGIALILAIVIYILFF